jgi:uncharacterized protein
MNPCPSSYLGATINGTITEFLFAPWYDVPPALGITLLIGPIEEFGWRGGTVATPAPLRAALGEPHCGCNLGLLVSTDIPFQRNPQSAWSFGPFVIGVLALSVILTLRFNAGCGSILSAILFHFQMNSPAWPDAQPWENFRRAVVAVVVVVLNRRMVLTCDGAVNEVLLPAEDGSSDHAHIDT